MSRNYQSIQYLRGIAALLVVVHHIRTPRAGLWNPLEHFGTLQVGVDIFFVISGFVMFVAARDEHVISFLARRLLRVAPLYWISTGVWAAILLRGNPTLLNGSFLADLLKSIFFIPFYNVHEHRIWPVLVPGWTLNFEIFFYLLFALGLALRSVPLLPCVVIPLLVLLGVTSGARNPIWVTYTNPILLEFGAGLLLGYVYHRGRSSSALLAWAVPVGVMLLVATSALDLGENERTMWWSVPAFLVVLGATALERSGHLPDVALLKKLGDASYSIYLFHIPCLTAMAGLFKKLPLTGAVQFSLFLVSTSAVAAVVGYGLHHALERPLTAQLRRWIEHRLPDGHRSAAETPGSTA